MARPPVETLEFGASDRSTGVDSPSRNVNDVLAYAIGCDIIAGIYAPGSLLPTEGSLLERFEVSRPTLREAFRVLSAKGLIVSRRKVGTRVRPKADWNMLDPDILAWHLQVAPSEEFVTALFELRQLIEPQAAALAARSPNAAVVQKVADCYAEMDRAARGGDIIGADLRFHESILEATCNPFIGALGGLIKTALVGSFQLGWRSPVRMQENRLAQHRHVMQAIVARDAEGAHARMAELLRDSIEDVRSQLRGNEKPAVPDLELANGH